MLLLHAVVTGLVTGPSRGSTSSPATGQSRRQLLSGGALAFVSLATSRPCAADGFGDFAQQQQTEARSDQAVRAAAERQKLQDPFAAARAQGREGVYADELPPLSAAERTERAERVKQLAAETRPAPKVDTVQTGLPVGRSNVERGLAAPDARPAVPTDEYTLEFDCGQPLGLTLRDLRVALETQSGQVLGGSLELGPLVGLGLGRAGAGAGAGAAYPILSPTPTRLLHEAALPTLPALPALPTLPTVPAQGTSRVLVGDVLAGGQAARVGRVAIDSVVVAVDGVNVERESAPQIRARLAKLRQEGALAVRVTFRDSLAFNAQLKTGTPLGAGASVATTVAPGGSGQAEQVLGVTVLDAPERCRRTAAVGDLMEIRYAGRLASDGSMLDSNHMGSRPCLCVCRLSPHALRHRVRRHAARGALRRRLDPVCPRQAACRPVPPFVGPRPRRHVRRRAAAARRATGAREGGGRQG